MKLPLMTAALLTIGSASAQQLSAQSIIVNPQQDLSVQLQLDRAGTNPTYRAGENIAFTVTPTDDAYLYVFNVDGTGQIDLLTQNSLWVKSGTRVNFPPSGSRYVTSGSGVNKLLALASREPIPADQLRAFQSAQAGMLRGQDGLARALSIIVEPMNSAWATASATYTVQAQTMKSTLFVGSNVPGAQVTLQGKVLGSAGVSYANLEPGTYALKVTAPGYAEYRTTVTLQPRQTAVVNAELTANARSPRLLDLIGDLLGLPGMTQTNPAQAALDREVTRAQQDGWQPVSRSAQGGIRSAFLTRGSEQLTLTVTPGANRTVTVRSERTATYSY